MGDDDGGPVGAGHAVEADDLGVEVGEGEEAEQAGELDGVAELAGFDVGPAADGEGGAGLGDEEGLGGGELGGLVFGEVLGGEVAGDDLEREGDGEHAEGDADGAAVEGAVGAAEHAEGVDAEHGGRDADVGGERHVGGLGGERGRAEGGEGVDADELAVDEFEAHGGVHPGVDGDDEHAAREAGEGDDDAAGEVEAGGEAVAAVEVEAEEDGFDEEREAFEAERHADDGAGVLHEARPEQAEFEAEHGAGDGADGEEDGGAFGPLDGELAVDGRAAGGDLGDDHEQGHGHAGDGEEDVEAERHRHLGARGEEVGHGCLRGTLLARAGGSINRAMRGGMVGMSRGRARRAAGRRGCGGLRAGSLSCSGHADRFSWVAWVAGRGGGAARGV